MKALGDYVTFLSNIGVDGIIVQDLGIIRLCRRTYLNWNCMPVRR